MGGTGGLCGWWGVAERQALGAACLTPPDPQALRPGAAATLSTRGSGLQGTRSQGCSPTPSLCLCALENIPESQ